MLHEPRSALGGELVPSTLLAKIVRCLMRYRPNMIARLSLLVFAILAFGFAPFAQSADDFLEPEKAFQFSAAMSDSKTIIVTYVIADGYYMYRDRFKFSADGAKLDEPIFTPGKIKFDETFQKDVETYNGTISIRLPVEAASSFTLYAISQGCAEKGLCYAPMSSQLTLFANNSGDFVRTNDGINVANISSGKGESNFFGRLISVVTPSTSGIFDVLKSKNLLAILPLFFLFGLALSFTPCVLPMVPILSYIIVGEGATVTRHRGLVLSFTYSIGMALVYTGLGIASGLIGEGLSAYMQNPLVLGSFAIFIVILSLSMFGVYQLQMPAQIQQKMMRISNEQKAGKIAGVFIMGALSALILSPCVTAPLTGVLLYISQTRDAVFGGYALFTIAVGMSVPLMLVGFSAGALLPRAGIWMNSLKRFFGVLMLAMALWIISPLASVWAQMLGWSVLLLAYGGFLLYPRKGGWFSKVFGLIFVLLGMMLAIGAVKEVRPQMGAQQTGGSASVHKLQFKKIKSVAQLDAALSEADGKYVMLDFYADWCVACKEMEKLTFSDVQVQEQLAEFLLLQVDVTANDADDRAMLRRFKLFGPPGIIFFAGQGQEIDAGRVVGYQNAETFLKSLNYVKQFQTNP